MNHTIDTKAILELAETSPEAKAYLEREFPEVFPKNAIYYYYNIVNGNDALFITHEFIKDWRLATTEEIQKFIPDYKPNTK